MCFLSLKVFITIIVEQCDRCWRSSPALYKPPKAYFPVNLQKYIIRNIFLLKLLVFSDDLFVPICSDLFTQSACKGNVNTVICFLLFCFHVSIYTYNTHIFTHMYIHILSHAARSCSHTYTLFHAHSCTCSCIYRNETKVSM